MSYFDWAHSKRLTWKHKISYLSNRAYIYSNMSCYDIFNGQHSKMDFFIKNNYTILMFEYVKVYYCDGEHNNPCEVSLEARKFCETISRFEGKQYCLKCMAKIGGHLS